MLRMADAVANNPWQFCLVCQDKYIFSTTAEFRRHLRQFHCSKEGGSFVCHYGKHGVCQSLPLEGVNSKDYEDHVEKVHVYLDGRVDPSQVQTQQSSSMIAKPKIPKFKVDDVKTWTKYSSQNLSSALNDPRRHGRHIYLFTQLWGESFVPQEVVPLTLLPNIPKVYFDGYIKRMEFKFMGHQKLKRTLMQTGDILSPTIHPGDVGFSYAASSLARKQNLDGPQTDLEAIPEIFLQANFTLEDPSTFHKVLPWSSVNSGKNEDPSRPMSPKKSRKLLQEKLSHYLDMTEVRLAQQIASRSDDFFRTMSSHDKLEVDVSKTCTDIQHLRVQMTKIEDILIKKTLSVMRLFRLRSRCIAVQEKLKLMATIHQTQPTIQVLLSTSDYLSALDLIDTSLEILQQELAGVQCFRHLGSQLSEMKNVIERMMEADFIDFASANLNIPSRSDGGNGLYEEERLLSVVLGLLRQKRFRFLHLYKDEVYSMIKSTIKEEVYSSLYGKSTLPDNEEESPKVGEAIRAVTHQEWVAMMEKVFEVSLKLLKRIKLIHESLCKVLTIAVGHNLDDLEASLDDIETVPTSDDCTLITTSEYNRLSTESKELIWSACELAQIRCSKLITMRSKGGALDQLSSSDFVLLARAVEGFVTDCEKVCGRQSHNLRGTLLSQAKRFVEKFHEERKNKLGLILDNERWKQADVPVEFQTLVDSITKGMESNSASPKQQKKNQTASGKATGYLVAQNQRYVVVGTLLLVMKMVVEYCQCVDDTPVLTAEILTKLCEILKSYNSRLCQLVLGAGALKTVGLKTITAKHLGLAAQCLEVIIIHIPIFKSHFEVRVPPKQYVLLSQFDQILKDYRNHRHEIVCKLVNLMEEVFSAHLQKYEARPPMPSSGMRAIVKQILKLHETLSSVFQEQQLEPIFREIRRSFRSMLAEKLASIGIVNDGSPQSGLVTSDIAFFAESVKHCSGMNDIGRKFDELWTMVREIRNRKLHDVDNKLPKRR
ncbi:vacuolar protein sorting-associated protein 54-like isoform X1 [Rhopilema esculentum]|uniref:vacuolar protein sorting-associated protein 54-like isoform X1 n=1 Tax=Rhopilema esculentum TaxID=499914 RepID=UPI0031DCC5B5